MAKVEKVVVGLMALLLALLVVALMTTPTVFFLDKALAGYPHDGFEHFWKFWWTYRAIAVEHTDLANTYLVNHPSNPTAPQFAATPFAYWLGLPFLGWLDPVAFYNGVLLASFLLTLLTTWLFCWRVTGEPLPAVLGALVFAFFPNKTKHLLGGHLMQGMVFLFPLYGLALWRLTRKPKWRDGIWLGLLAGASLLVYIKHIAYFMIPFTALFLLGDVWPRRREIDWPAVLRVGGLAVLLTLVIVAPFFVPFVEQAAGGGLDYFDQEGFERFSVDLLGVVTPPPEHVVSRFWPALTKLGERLSEEGYNENAYYLGWVALPLAALGAWRGDRSRKRPWLWVTLGGLLLAMGPALKVVGRVLPFPLPYALLRHLPFYEWAHTPGRMEQVAVLGMAVLVTLGAGFLLKKVKERGRLLLVVLLAGLLLADYAVIPWPVADVTVSPFYRTLAEEPGDGAVLDLPLWDYVSGRYQLYYQTVHGRPIVGGFLDRRQPEVEVVMGDIESLALPGDDPAAPLHLADYGVEYVILHHAYLEPADLTTETDWLSSTLGAPVYTDERITVFQVPEQTP